MFFSCFSDQNLCKDNSTRGMDVQHQVNICKCKLFWNEVRINVVFVSVLNEGVGIIPRRPISIASTKVILGLSKTPKLPNNWRVFCSSAFLSLPNKIVAHDPTYKETGEHHAKDQSSSCASHGLTFPGCAQDLPHISLSRLRFLYIQSTVAAKYPQAFPCQICNHYTYELISPQI